MSGVGAIEVTISNGGWGGDFGIDETGDLELSQDEIGAPQATIERMTRLVLTTPNLTDQNGNAIGYADDIFHVDWGAGIRAYVDENISTALLQKIVNRIRTSMLADDQISKALPPVIDAQIIDSSNATLSIRFWTNDGASGVLPTLSLTPSNVTFSSVPLT